MDIFVNKPYLPSFKKYISYLEQIWHSNQLSNFGPLHNLLESKLEDFLGVKSVNLVNNGTIALNIAYKLMGLKKDDDIITTPFSFVATTNTAIWDNLKLTFCDIDRKTLNLDSQKVQNELENATKNAKNFKAIVAVHVFGNPCDVLSFKNLAKKYKVKIIYDAAHAFGVKYKNKSVLNYGDISTISFHATKLFHTIEGGAIINSDKNATREMINFGLKNALPHSLGINAKLSEFNAAMGLCILDDMNIIEEKRQEIFDVYKSHLKEHYSFQEFSLDANNNYHYFPIIFKTQKDLKIAIKALNDAHIFPRRYFYPSLNNLPYLNAKSAKDIKNIEGVKDYNNAKSENLHSNSHSNCPIAKDIANRILCLPLYVGLEKNDVLRIIKILYSLHQG